MFDFIPIQDYTSLYYYVILFTVLITWMHNQLENYNSTRILRYNNYFGGAILIFILLYMGFRPVNGVFVDMTNYNRTFEAYGSGRTLIKAEGDLLFHIFTKTLSSIVSATTYFFICALLYVVPLYIICKKWFKNHWFYGFLFLVSAFSFWAYGVNGMRNGIAGSFFLLGVSREKRFWQILLIIVAIGFHKSMLLPTLGFIIANLYNQPKKIIAFWFLCIPVSLIAGGWFESFFANLGFSDNRLSYLATEVSSDTFSYTGFRWDFLLYSGTAIFAGWYYIIKLKFRDQIYDTLFITYTFSNAFWILIIRANFSNRFAYLSWFMMAIIIIYPLFKKHIISDQHKKIGFILSIYFSFTFLMNVILS